MKPAEAAVILAIKNGITEASKIAEFIRMDKVDVESILNRLCMQGYVKPVKKGFLIKRTHYVLTQKGYDLVKEAERILNETVNKVKEAQELLNQGRKDEAYEVIQPYISLLPFLLMFGLIDVYTILPLLSMLGLYGLLESIPVEYTESEGEYELPDQEVEDYEDYDVDFDMEV